MINIINAEEIHMPEILEIEQLSISPPWSEGALLSEVGREDALFALAVEDGDDVKDGDDVEDGTVLGFCILHRAADEGELYQIAVREDCRRRGIAEGLMKAAIDYCRKNAVLSIYLEVRRSNEAAIHLYKKHGFKNDGRRKNYYSSPVEDAIMMSLALQAE